MKQNDTARYVAFVIEGVESILMMNPWTDELSTSDGTPVVDINISKSRGSGGIKKQKIHFVKGEDKK